jgi:hypothetical protein
MGISKAPIVVSCWPSLSSPLRRSADVLCCRSLSLHSFLVPYWVTGLLGGNEMRFGYSNTPAVRGLGFAGLRVLATMI